MADEILEGQQRGWILFYQRLRLESHWHQHPELPANKEIVWDRTHGRWDSGRRTKELHVILIEDGEAEFSKECANLLRD